MNGIGKGKCVEAVIVQQIKYALDQPGPLMKRMVAASFLLIFYVPHQQFCSNTWRIRSRSRNLQYFSDMF